VEKKVFNPATEPSSFSQTFPSSFFLGHFSFGLFSPPESQTYLAKRNIELSGQKRTK